MRWAHLEIWDGGINSIERKVCVTERATGQDKESMCENEMLQCILHRFMCVNMCEKAETMRSCLEVRSFKSSWRKFVVIRGDEEWRLFNIKPNVMLAYTLNRKPPR